MAKSSALTWILREAKRLRKKYPKRYRQWKDYVAQASAIYASKHKGKSPVGRKKKKTATKKKVARKKTARKRSRKKKTATKVIKQRVTVERTVSGKRKKKRSKPKSKPAPRRRKVSGKGSNSLLIGLAIGGGLYLLLSSMNKPATTTPTVPYYGQYGQLSTTTNQVRNTQSQDLVNYAIAAGLAADAISKLVASLNSSSDDQIKQAYDYVNTTGDIGVYV